MRPRHLLARRFVSLVGSLAVLMALAAASPAQAKGTLVVAVKTTVPLQFVRTVGPLTSLSVRGTSRVQASSRSAVPSRRELRLSDRQGSVLRKNQRIAARTPVAPASVGVSYGTRAVVRSWQGSSHFDTRYSDGGNQFSGEPPDQGLCVGDGYALETVNQVVQIYNERGRPLLPGTSGAPVPGGRVGLSLNQFYGFASAFVRPGGPFGPFAFDPSCQFDAGANRWYHLADVLDQDPATGAFTGTGGQYLSVSQTANPLGKWDVYFLDTVDNGTGGTPDHGCPSGFCFGDFPHIGADAYGVYITTNEFDFVDVSDFIGVQLYAISKPDLVAGTATEAVMLQNVRPAVLATVFTMRPAQSRPTSYERGRGGVEYFTSTTAPIAFPDAAHEIVVFALTNTSSLGSGSPSMSLKYTIVPTIPYLTPQTSRQKAGPTPLLHCINLGVACIGTDDGHQDGPVPIDSGDGRALSAYFSNGVLWATAATALRGTGEAAFNPSDGSWAPIHERAGVVYFAVRPSLTFGLTARMLQEGYIAVRHDNITYPSIAVDRNNVGFVGVTLVGPDFYPSAAYVRVGLGIAPSVVHVVGPGRGPSDGFAGTAEGGFSPRWGDYGYATAGPGDTIWVASEYTESRCTFATFSADSTCGGTRSFFANWSTRVTELMP